MDAQIKNDVSDNRFIFIAQTLRFDSAVSPEGKIESIEAGGNTWQCAVPVFGVEALDSSLRKLIVRELSGFSFSGKKGYLRLDYVAEKVDKYYNFTFYADNVEETGGSVGKIIDEKSFRKCVDSETLSFADISSLFEYEDFSADFLNHVRSKITNDSSLNGFYDAAKLSAWFSSGKLPENFSVTDDGVTVYFGEEEFALNCACISVSVPKSVIASCGKPGGYAYYEPVLSDTEKVIALTFDDGPHYTNTKKLLDIIEEKRVKVTFFVQGVNMDTNGDGKIETWAKNYMTRAVELGCEYGNHSYNHANFNNLTNESAMSQIQRTSDLIFQGSGVQPVLFRAPYGNLKGKTELVSAAGYHIVYWSVDTLDWSYAADFNKKTITRDECIQKTLDVIKKQAKSGGIILMHDIHAPSVDTAALAIDYLVEQGYRLVTVSELCDLRGRIPDATVIYNRSSIRKQ